MVKKFNAKTSNNMFHKINYFKKAKEICADDFNEPNKVDTINLSLVSSLTELQDFRLPFSGTHKGHYALLTMNNGDRYYILTNSFMDLRNAMRLI